MHSRNRLARMARTGATLAAVGAAGVLAACGSSDDDGGKAAAKSAGPPKPGIFCAEPCQKALTLKADPASIEGKVGLSLNSLAFAYGVVMKEEAEDQVKKSFPGIDLTVTDGQGSGQKQSQDVDDLVARGIKVLLISPYQADSLVPAIERAKKAGVKVITVDRSANADVESFISPDDEANGMAVGEYLAKKLGGKGKIIEITGTPGASATIARGGGFHKAIDKYPGIQVVAQQNGDYLRGPSLKVTEDLLQRYKKGSFDAIFAHADEMSVGVAQALREAGRDGEVPVVSINAEEAGLDLIKGGQLDATAVYSTVAREGIIAAAKVIAGEKLPKRIPMDATLVTEDNVDEFVGKTW